MQINPFFEKYILLTHFPSCNGGIFAEAVALLFLVAVVRVISHKPMSIESASKMQSSSYHLQAIMVRYNTYI